MPFYLYGTESQRHIDHMLLCAPNTDLSSESVVLELDQQPSADQLSKGLLLFIDRHEEAMQPMDQTNPPVFFAPGATFNAEIYTDTQAPDAHGPGLAVVDAQQKIASGKVTLGSAVRTEYTALNNQEFGNASHFLRSVLSSNMSLDTRAEWKNMVGERLDISFKI